MNALETVLGTAGVVDPAELDARARDVLATPSNRNHHEPHHDPVAVDPARGPGRG